MLPVMNRTVVALSLLYVLTLIAFAGLYLFTPPREVVREIIREATPAPVERIVQPVEKMVQDTLRPILPAATDPKLPAWDTIPAIGSEADVLRAVGPLRLNVTVNEVLSKILTAEAARVPVLSALDKHQILVDPGAPNALNVSIHAQWDGAQEVMAYRITISLSETALILRADAPLRAPADVWQRGSYGFANKLVARDTVTLEALRLAETFAQGYLTANAPAPAAASITPPTP